MHKSTEMVKFNMLVCLLILGFIISIFESCDCAFLQKKFDRCVGELNNEGFKAGVYDGPPTDKNERVHILKKMLDPSLCEAGKKYIERLNIDYSLLYEKLRNEEDEPDKYNDVYNPSEDLDVLHTLINKNVDNLSDQQLGEVGNFDLSPRTFCNEANTMGATNYIPDLYNSEDDSSDNENNNDHFDNFNIINS